MKKILFLLMLCSIHAILPVQEKTVRKIKSVIKSEPVRLFCSLFIGAGIGAGITFFIQKMIHQKKLKKMQQEQERVWNPGYQIANALRNNDEQSIIKKYFNEELQKNIGYDEDKDAEIKGRRALTFNEKMQKTIQDSLMNDIRQKGVIDKLSETKLFKLCEPHNDGFMQLYNDMYQYNSYLISIHQKPWDVELIKVEVNTYVNGQEGKEYLIGGVYINPPSAS